MDISYGGEVYDLDLQAVTLKQAMVIQSYIGMSVMKLFEQFGDIEEDTPELLKAIGAVYWLMMNQAGKQFPIADADFALVPFLESFFTALKDAGVATAEEAVAEPGPTVPSPASSASLPVPPSLAAPQTPNGQEAMPAQTVS